jgi:short-subunit dehydrogenase
VLFNVGKHSSAYLASKHALFAYVNCLRQELLHYNHPTTISVACPYEVESGMFWGIHKKLGLIFPELKEEYLGKRLLQEFISKK